MLPDPVVGPLWAKNYSFDVGSGDTSTTSTQPYREGPLLDYQTKPSFDPGVAVVGQMRAKTNIKVITLNTDAQLVEFC